MSFVALASCLGAPLGEGRVAGGRQEGIHQVLGVRDFDIFGQGICALGGIFSRPTGLQRFSETRDLSCRVSGWRRLMDISVVRYKQAILVFVPFDL